MILDPERYSSARVYDLLDAAAHGRVGVDRRWLRAILDRGEDAVDDLLRFGFEDRSGDPVGLDLDLIDIFRYLRTPRAVPYYIELLRSAPEEAADELLEAFTQVPEASLEPLLELYDELDEEARGEVAFLLAALRVRDRRVLDRLKQRIAADPADAAFCLGVSGDPEARPILEGLLEAPPETGDPADFRECVRQALADLEQPARLQEDPDAGIWELYPETAPPRFDVLREDELLEFLRQGTAESRAGAAEALISRELSGEAIEALFHAARTDAEATVRAAAWEALGRVIEERGDIREAMLACLDDAAAPLEERCGALVGLAQEAEDPVVRRWMIEFYGVPAARAKALEAMRNSLDRRFSPYFPQHLDDPDPEVREQSILGVGELAIRSEAGRLRALFEDEDFRAAALYAYALAAPAEISPARARAFLKRVDREAGGLDPAESSVVREAIDLRLRLNGHDPVFAPGDEEEGPRRAAPDPAPPKAGRNDPCPCGSGKKYKKCCGA